MSADYIFMRPAMKTIQDLTKAGHNVYMYYFDRVPEFNAQLLDSSSQDFLWPYVTETPKFRIGAKHALEIPYIFGVMSYEPGVPTAMSQTDQNIGKSMLNAWTSFAATG